MPASLETAVRLARQDPVAGLLLPANTEDGFSGGGVVDSDFDVRGVPLLNTFGFLYLFTDHHLSDVIILLGVPRPGKIRIAYHDKNRDDDYHFTVIHRPVSDPRIREFDTGDAFFKGKAIVPIERPQAGGFVFVLKGFQLSYRVAGDRHVAQLGILEDDGLLTLSFGDENLRADVRWRVQYAYVPRDLFASVGEAREVRAKHPAGASIPPGLSVIRGFMFEYEPYFTSGHDHHLKTLGVVMPSSGQIAPICHDKNADDGFDWTIRWAVLASPSNPV